MLYLFTVLAFTILLHVFSTGLKKNTDGSRISHEEAPVLYFAKISKKTHQVKENSVSEGGRDNAIFFSFSPGNKCQSPKHVIFSVKRQYPKYNQLTE